MSKKESSFLKGLALILMFWHHLFGCGTFLTNGVYYDYKPLLGQVDGAFASGCKLCISLFAFASGYGLYKAYYQPQNDYKKIADLMLKFLIQYWTIMVLVAIPYLIYFNGFHPQYLFVNLFALIHDDVMLYVSLSWYVKVQILFLLHQNEA